MSLLGKNISANLVSNVWLALLLFLVTPVYIWFLGVESYGLVGFYLSWIAILGILDSGISATAMREFAWLEARPQERDKIPVLLKSLELVYWGIILVLGGGLLFGASFFGADWFQTKELEPDMVREAMMLMAISLIAQVPSGLYVAGLMGLQRQVECSTLLALFGTFRALGAILALWLISPDIRVFFLWQIVVSALQTGTIRFSIWRKVRGIGKPAEFSLRVIKSVKGFAGGMILITAISIVMTQADKVILSRLVSLEMFSYYMLAWTVASGLSRVATPLTQAFNPRFTELISRGDDLELAKNLRQASQLMNVIILPPAALILFFAQPILFAWTGDQAVAQGVAPILTVMIVGTVFASSSYPASSILYSRKLLRPVIKVNLICLVFLLPLLLALISYFGVIGAASIWSLYGFILYVAFQKYGWRGIPNNGLFLSILRDFFSPCVASLAVTGLAWYSFGTIMNGMLEFLTVLGVTLILGWSVAILVSNEIFKIVCDKLKWKSNL